MFCNYFFAAEQKSEVFKEPLKLGEEGRSLPLKRTVGSGREY
jgi:hypothetical protein